MLVLDKKTHLPLQAAAVSISGPEPRPSQQSSAVGVVRFSDLTPGTYAVSASKEGYSAVTSAATVIAGASVSTGASSPRAGVGDGPATVLELPPGGLPEAGELIVKVIDDDGNTPVVGITVHIEGQSAGVKADSPTGSTGETNFRPPADQYNVTHTSLCFTSALTSAKVEPGKTVKVELHIRRIHAALTISELTFSGHNPIDNDTLGPSAPPEWKEGRPQADQLPVSYARNKKLAFTAKLKVTKPPGCDEQVDIKASATFGSKSLEWTGTVKVQPSDKEVAVALTSADALPNEVGLFETSDITWQYSPGGAGLSAAGTTRNVVYVTLGDPSGSPNYWTLLEISCRGAAGKATEDDFVKASFAPFRGTLGDGNGFKRRRDGVTLTYYKDGAGTPSSGVFSCSDLLSRADGTGRCGAWARFLVAMHQVHGVTSSSVLGVVPVSAALLIVKNCTFTGAGSLSPPFTHVGQTECVKNDGIFGQGKNNPQFTFGDHALVEHSTGIYDPSYGVGPKADLKVWEDGGIIGVGAMPLKSFTFGGNPHIVPGACSPGFIRYTAVTGDTLASIASRFGIASAAVLYNHRYNAALRALHPPPGKVDPGDLVIIPRDIASKVSILKRSP